MVFQITVKLRGLERILRNRSEAVNRKILDKLFTVMVDEMTYAVIDGKLMLMYWAAIRTGRLIESLDILEIDREGLSVTGGTHVFYAHFLEFGTVKMHARPYWRPSVWHHFFELRPKMIQVMKGCRE